MEHLKNKYCKRHSRRLRPLALRYLGDPPGIKETVLTRSSLKIANLEALMT